MRHAFLMLFHQASLFTSICTRLPVVSACTFYTVLHTHTHPFNGPFLGLPRWACTRKVKPIWILQKQETVSGSRISWSICKSAPRSRQTTTPAPHQHHTVLHELKFESLWEWWLNALNDVKPSELWTPHTTQLRTNVVLIPYSFLLDFYTAQTVTDYSEAEVPL